MSEFLSKFGYYILTAIVSCAFTMGVYSSKTDARMGSLEAFQAKVESQHIDETVYQVKANTAALSDMQQRLYNHNGKVDAEFQKLETQVAALVQKVDDLKDHK